MVLGGEESRGVRKGGVTWCYEGSCHVVLGREELRGVRKGGVTWCWD